jgi:beta-ureidopropionase / N-carbamoyl-L-amino-acid hydrolase
MTNDKATAVVQAVREDRLWQRHMEIAAMGATGHGGVNRQALTPEDAQARRWMLDWAAQRDYATAADAMGNTFAHRPGQEETLAPVVAGSHLDTQPAGGNFDGIFGVLAAMEVLDAAADAGVVTKRPLEVVNWTNEEGSRFQPTTMGSAVFAGNLSLADVLTATDTNGIPLAKALAETMAAAPVPTARDFAAPMSAYLEAHIEQGPVLESAGKTIGVVTGIQGLRWFLVRVSGEESHAGTTPRANRKDALAAALDMIKALQDLMADRTDVLRFTVGRLEVSPNSPNTVPGGVLFTIDFRHPDSAVLKRLGDLVEKTCRDHARGCGVEVQQTLDAAPTQFDPGVVDLVRAAAAGQGLPHMDILSGATHDAKFMTGLCPSAMIFVPCERGISHSESEYATPADLAAGTRVLAEAMIRLAER